MSFFVDLFNGFQNAGVLQLQEEVDRCKSTYDALNSQLLEELPKFLEIVTDVYVVAIKEFISNRRLFVGRITQELLSLMDVSNTILAFNIQR